MSSAPGIESGYAWRLAVVSMICVAAGGGSVYLPIVAMSQMAQEFGGQRQVPSLAYTLGYLGMGAGGIMMGWLSDRLGPRPPLLIAALCIVLGAWLGSSGGEVSMLAGYSLLMGFLGNSATFTPMLNNIQGWFEGRRGIAVAIVSVGPAVGGFTWPQIYRSLLPDHGWRDTLMIFGVIAAAIVTLAALYMRRAPIPRGPGNMRARETLASLPMPSAAIMALLSAASFCCCLAMAMPFAHMVAFCGDLGFAPERGAEAVSLILLSAIASTFAMGRLADKIGPLPTSLICSAIQIVALVGFLFVAKLWGIYTCRRSTASVHRHRAGLRADPARAVRAGRRRLAPGRRAVPRHGRHGGWRLDWRRDLRRHRLLHLGLPVRADRQPGQSRAADDPLPRAARPA